MPVPADVLTVARNRARAASILAWLAAMFAGWAVFAIADHQEIAAEYADPGPEPRGLLDERYCSGYAAGLDAREAREAAGES
jgi:hypothetical protein